MRDVVSLMSWLGLSLSWVGELASKGALIVLRFAPPPPPSGDTQPIKAFFDGLTADLTLFALAMAGFFFALSALFYMASGATGNERARQHAISSLYAALVGLALALLAGSIAALVNTAAGGK